MEIMKSPIKYFICFFVILTILVPATAAFSNDAQSLQERFKKEAPEAWKDYLNHLRTIKVMIRYSIQSPKDSYSDVMETTRTLDLPYALTESKTFSSADPEPVYSLIGNNPRYRFVLTKDESAESDVSSWKVKYVNKIEEKAGEFQFPGLDAANSELPSDNSLVLLLSEALKIHFMFFLPSLCASEDFEITDITEESEDGQKIVHIVYRHEPQGVVGVVGPPALRSGELWLIPDRSWVVKKAVVNILDTGDRTDKLYAITNIEYKDDGDCYPIPHSVETILKRTDTDETEATFFNEFTQTRDFKGINKKECYLSYYGIPEPKFEGDGDWRRHAIVLLGLVIVAAAYFVFQRRRNAKHRTEE